MKALVRAVVLALSLMPSLAFAGARPRCAAPDAMSDGWSVASPVGEGLNPSLICSIGPSLENLHGAYPDGVVVVRHDTLVYEHYFATGGMEYSADALHGIRSITKGVIGLLVGIAVDRGWLNSVDDRVFSYLPGDADLSQGKDGITLRDLLTMTSGLRWPESAVSYDDPSNIERRMNVASDPYRFVLAQPLSATPGTVWNYNSGGVEVLGDILMKVSHQPLNQLAQHALFDPLGINHWAWLQSPNGKLGASWGLWLRPRDLAKIGQLVLDHGAWHGHQIVAAQWINAMVAPQVHRPSSWPSGAYEAYSYGYLWWLGRLEARGHDVDWVAWVGWGGQRLYVVPSLDLVVVVAASNDNFGARQYLAGYTALEIALRAVIKD